MNAPTDVPELMEHIQRSATVSPPAHQGSNGAVREALEAHLPPPLPGFAPYLPSDPLPLAEAANMVPRAREKLSVRPEVPGLLRPMFRNQGGFNGVLLETCGRLVEVSAQLRQENDHLRARVDTLVDYLTGQNDWLETTAHTLAGTSNTTSEGVRRLDAAQTHLGRVDTRLDSAEGLLGRLTVQGDEHAATLARLETQTEQHRAWTQNLQLFVDEQSVRDSELEARLEFRMQQSFEQLARQVQQGCAQIAQQVHGHVQELQRQAREHAEHLHTVDLRLDEAGSHINHLQAEDDRQNEYIQTVHGHMDRLGEHVGLVERAGTGSGGHLNSLQESAERMGSHLRDLQAHHDIQSARLEEATQVVARAREELKQAASNQHLLEDNNRRLEERQVNDAGYLRAQLAFQQRLIGQWLSPATGPATPANIAEPAGMPESAAGKPSAGPAQAAALFREHAMDSLYLAFEDTMRGRRDTIKERVRFYVPYLKDAGTGSLTSPVLDLGCGRGEWLEVLREEGIEASGVDLNICMIDQCRERGLDARLVDVLEHLASVPAGSCGAVTAFHLIEHLPFPVLVQFIQECRRVLRPGGLAIFETPNPSNILVGACTFYSDYTHQRPLPPDSTRFLIEHGGFERAEIVALNPRPPEQRVHGDGTNEALIVRFNELFYGPQDYAIIARTGDLRTN